MDKGGAKVERGYPAPRGVNKRQKSTHHRNLVTKHLLPVLSEQEKYTCQQDHRNTHVFSGDGEKPENDNKIAKLITPGVLNTHTQNIKHKHRITTHTASDMHYKHV